ncbi:MAG TPA: rRNA methyltransferase [Firmicutes bacterium]|nr:rRNA methyltransferase [Bacillota bacterium]
MKPKTKRIFSANNDFQRVEVLKRNREKRNKYQQFFVEGVKAINYALEYNWPIQWFVYSREKPLSAWAEEILRQSQAELHLELPYQLMVQLSEKEAETSELIAVVGMVPHELSRIRLKDDLLVVIFDRPASHGNLGTLIRSCEALKVDALIITGHAVDLYDPKTIRASMGTFFAVPTFRLPSHHEVLPWLAKVRTKFPAFQIVGATAKAALPVDEADLTKPTALLIGNETYGLSNNYQESCDLLVRIPMYGAITSFNVACAASIILYETDRQRRKLDRN